MSKWIDAEWLLNCFKPYPNDYQTSLGSLRACVDNAPSIDIEPKRGEWIEIGTISHSYKCSVCGRTLFHTTVGKNHVTEYYPYCHCGAKMKGAEDERG